MRAKLAALFAEKRQELSRLDEMKRRVMEEEAGRVTTDFSGKKIVVKGVGEQGELFSADTLYSVDQ